MVSRESRGARILSIDVGSSSVRAELYDGSGDGIDGTEVKLDYEFDYTPDGGAAKDADELLDLVVRAVDGALSRAGNTEISGVAMSTFWHSVLGLDREGRPTTPILTWADRRAAESVPELLARLDERTYHRRTGCVPHSSYWPAKLLWSNRAMAGASEKTEIWVSPADYFYAHFFGEPYQVGTSMASGTGLFDQNQRNWDPETLGALPVEEAQLSAISDEPRKGLAGEWARRWPALREAPWLPAAGDGACSNVGSGCTGSDRLAIMVGTSGAMRVLWKAESVEIPDGPWCYRADAERYVMGGALSDGGNLIEWLRNTLHLPDPEETERLLSDMEPDSHGLTFLPLLAGERGPGWADMANGTVSGLSMSSKPVEIVRAAMEAVAFRFAIIAEMLETASPGEKEVVASGGGLLHSPTWTRIIADTLGRPVTLSGVKEASSRGAALIALEALGGPEIEAAEAPLGETFEPDPDRHEIYMRALERQRRLYDAVLGGS
ncbi:MAG: gluconokinase [Rubrobacteraceae bacterium]|nr:gluconokinase [Rubrobacteraceae bacterium]MDQ3251721.1 gluconokinase [Actinomycetota bacterium]MDQ3437881.1 gluconokinase [Actinomycetota bacterium]